MNITEIESDLQNLISVPFDAENFVYSFIEIYKAPKATINKLKQGSINQAKLSGDILWKNKFFFRLSEPGKAAQTVDDLLSDPLIKRHNPRFVFSTDGVEVHCRDLKSDSTINVNYNRLNEEFLFFLPLAGIERYDAVAENPADIKATGKLAKLYDSILEANPDWIDRDHTHELNLFMTRMLFCFFAESTSIFDNRIFINTVTFLMAPVHLIRSFDAINLNTNKLENLMHRFFASARLDIEIMDRFGKPFKPREWFLLPLEVIEEAIKLMLDGTILVYKYDKLTQTIVKIN